MSRTPKGWASAMLSDVARWSSGGTPSRANPSFFSGAIPWIKTGELGGQYLHSAEEHISREAVNSSAAKVFPKGTVLLAMYGATIGKASILAFDASTNQACAAGIPEGVSSLFLHYFLLSQREAFVEAGKGGAQPNISQGIVRDWPILVPPAAEQTRIVDKLEELLSDLDAGVAELKAAQKKLAQYRQSLLKAAVEGRLTEAWRAQHGEPEESGAQLLARILRERRARWEAKQLAKFEAQGKAPPSQWRDRYAEPTPANTDGLPVLPANWVWASIEHLGEVQLGRQRSPDKMLGINPAKYIRAANIKESGIDFDDVLTMDFSESERQTFGLRAGDVLLTEASGSPEHVGRPAVWPEVEGLFCFQNTVLRFRPQGIGSTYAFRVFQALQKLGTFQKLSGGVGINHLSAGKFSALAVPLPPVAEQLAVVEALESTLLVMAEQERTIQHALRQSAAQRKNILQAAFSGQLVPQDPNDEPASVLLARIHAERAASGIPIKARGRKKKETS